MFLPCIFFFFKQMTAYVWRISDWISDVCSSDLLYPLVPYRFTVRSAHDNSRGSGLLTCHRPIASRMLDVDEECCQIGRIGKTCDLAAHRTDQKALRLLGRLIDIEHGIVTKGLVNGRAGHAGIAGHTKIGRAHV